MVVNPDTTLAYRKLADVNVTLRDVVETSVVESAGKKGWTNTFAQQETLGANNDDVFVREHAGLLLVNFSSRFELCVVIDANCTTVSL